MLSFLKVFLRGIVCTVLLPLIVLVWVLYGAYCFIAFIFMLVKSCILFFTGENAAGDMKEDIEAKRLLLEREQSQNDQAQMMNAMYQNVMNQMAQQAMNQSVPQQATIPTPQQPVFPTPQQPVSNPVPQQNNSDFNPFAPSENDNQTSINNNNQQEGGSNNGESY